MRPFSCSGPMSYDDTLGRPSTSHSVRSVGSRRSTRSVQSSDPTGKLRSAARVLHSKGLGDTAKAVERAVRLGTPQLTHEDEIPYQTVKKKIVRKVEVPFTRKVKVPTKSKQLVPTKKMVRVKSTKLVPVTTMKEVKEEVTEMVDKPVVRDKVVWVKKIVKETVMEKAPVKRTRMKKVPTIEYRPQDFYEDVEVEGNKVVEVEGYRVDEVQDRKLVEVEEEEEYILRPTRKIASNVLDAHELGRVKRDGERHLSRKLGDTVLQRHEVESADTDSVPSDTEVSEAMYRPTFNRIGFALTNGCAVKRVTRGGPADKAGIRQGDIVEFIGDDLEHETTDLPDFRRWVHKKDGPLRMKLLRGGTMYTTTVYRTT